MQRNRKTTGPRCGRSHDRGVVHGAVEVTTVEWVQRVVAVMVEVWIYDVASAMTVVWLHGVIAVMTEL